MELKDKTKSKEVSNVIDQILIDDASREDENNNIKVYIGNNTDDLNQICDCCCFFMSEVIELMEEVEKLRQFIHPPANRIL